MNDTEKRYEGYIVMKLNDDPSKFYRSYCELSQHTGIEHNPLFPAVLEDILTADIYDTYHLYAVYEPFHGRCVLTALRTPPMGLLFASPAPHHKHAVRAIASFLKNTDENQLESMPGFVAEDSIVTSFLSALVSKRKEKKRLPLLLYKLKELNTSLDVIDQRKNLEAKRASQKEFDICHKLMITFNLAAHHNQDYSWETIDYDSLDSDFVTRIGRRLKNMMDHHYVYLLRKKKTRNSNESLTNNTGAEKQFQKNELIPRDSSSYSDEVVSIVCAVSSHKFHQTRISAVYTPPLHRGHNYASTLVTHLCHIIQRNHPEHNISLFADQNAFAPNRVYRKVGFHCIAKFKDIEFESMKNS